MQKITNKVLILGTIDTWKKAPLGDPTWEVWGMGESWNWWGAYATRWFEIHPMSIILMDGWKRYSWLTECTIPVYMKKHYANIPASIPFPLAEVTKGFMKQFSSTFCYQLALAIYERFETIGLYGVDFSRGSLRERFVEWRGILYWMGVAAGRGIKIQFPGHEGDRLAHRYLYGLEYWDEVDDVRLQIRRACDLGVQSIIDGLGIVNYYKYKKGIK